ncbi:MULTISPECIES: hypothetical protein [unclassified Delftia]|uniref:hypothetical protein n=1 Tax=unclassified Delftia TaxID=2613839 RepID=UPI0019019191|nr:MULTISPECIES: hypothetical protein [unclassified Delftia]MBK0112318.1 hypothetical protein [Delftia sp. S65]MBK0118837.1 hypothetical protein [Delftia sp. S67]MBK0130095.1 hypothetical protein [Delftia sp. S66]
MFFWKIKDLKNALIHRELSEKQVFIYILIFVLLSIVAMEITRYLHPDRVGFWDYVDSFLSISIVLCGTVFSYRANGGSSGVDFSARFFSISLVVTLRHMFFLIPIALIFYAYTTYSYIKGMGINAGQVVMTGGVEVVLLGIWCINIYQSIVKNISDVSRA